MSLINKTFPIHRVETLETAVHSVWPSRKTSSAWLAVSSTQRSPLSSLQNERVANTHVPVTPTLEKFHAES